MVSLVVFHFQKDSEYNFFIQFRESNDSVSRVFFSRSTNPMNDLPQIIEAM